MQRSLAELTAAVTGTDTVARRRPLLGEQVADVRSLPVESMDDDVWIIFDGDVPLDDFLERNKPSKLTTTVAVYAKDPKQLEEENEEALLQEWDETKRHRSVKPSHVKKLAKKYGKVSGKWLIYRQRSEIDATWTTIATAVVNGTLGYASKVFKSADEPATYYVICVYTEDFTNEEEVWAAEKRLRELGIADILRYKPDIYTVLGIYAGNEWGIRPTIYQSRARN